MINLLYENEFSQKGLHLKVKSRYCSFRGEEIDLSPALFETFLILVHNPKEYQRLDPRVVEDDLMLSKEKTDVRRINKIFKDSGLTNKPIAISKVRVGYKLNPKVINPNLIKIED